MNLNEERSYQMYQEALDAMSLSEENRKLADEYLEVGRPEDGELLHKAAHQDFSVLDQNARNKCVSYVNYLQKRNRTEDLSRYVRFCAKVGGSTAKYVLFAEWVVSLNVAGATKIREYLTPEQAVAIQAEMLVWKSNYMGGSYFITNLISTGKQNPKIFRQAMNLCYHHSDNAKILLAGIFLYQTKSTKSQNGLLKDSSPETEKADSDDVKTVVSFLEDCLIAGAPELFAAGAGLTDAGSVTLREFLRNAAPDAAFTGEIKAVIDKGGLLDKHLARLLAGTAFMAIEYSDRFHLFVRFAMCMNFQDTMDVCKDFCGNEWLTSHLELLEQALPVKWEDYGCWCVANQIGQPLQRMAKTYEDATKRMLLSLDTESGQYLLSQVAKTNPSLHQELSAALDQEFRYKMSSELTLRYMTGKAKARDYLLGKIEIEQLYPFIDEWQRNTWRYSMDQENRRKMAQMRDGRDVPMFRRAVVLQALSYCPNYFKSSQVFPLSQGSVIYNYSNALDQKQIRAIMDVLTAERVPVVHQLKLMEAIHDSYYQDSCKSAFLGECVSVLVSKKGELAPDLIDQAQKGSTIVRLICIRALNHFWDEYKETLLSCALDSSKQVRELLANVYASHKEWEPEMLTMLSSKKSQERELAVWVLGRWGAASYREQLEKAHEIEKSKKIKDQITAVLEMGGDSGNHDQAAPTQPQTVEQLVTELLKGGKKRKVEWASEVFVSPVHKLDGTEVSTEYMQALLVAYADMNNLGVNQTAARLAAKLNQKELVDFMLLLFHKWVDTGAEAKKRWVLYAVSIHGGDTIVPALHHQIQVWPEAARGAIAAEAVRALALNGSSTALLLVDQIARKFKNRQVKNAAGEALTYAAEQLGITRAELEDRIVPSLDFDENQERHFDYGTRDFRVKLTSALELEIFDGSGKKLKSMPAPGKQDDEEKAKASSEAFKLLKKQLKTVVTNQKLRLEQALSVERLWPADKWQELFVKNPIMHQFAIGLIWGVYSQEKPETEVQSQNADTQMSKDGSQAQGVEVQVSKDNEQTSGLEGMVPEGMVPEGMVAESVVPESVVPEGMVSEGMLPEGESHGITLTATFRYMEDGSFNTVDEEEYELPKDAMIGLVHPVELSAETLAAWKEQLSDYEVTQPFEQLERPVYQITEEEKKQKELSRFGGVLLNGLSLSGKLLSQGWYRGPVEDGGVFWTYYRNDGANGVELEFSGSAVGYEVEEDVTVYGIYFYPSGEAVHGGYRYRKKYEKNRCLLSEVSPRYFSEIVLLMTRATASSKEKLAYPECKSN